MNIQFNHKVEFPDGRIIDLEFEAEFVSGGIGHFEHFGTKGYDSHPELDNIVCFSKLSKEDAKFVNSLISDGTSIDNAAWDAFNNQ